MKVKRNARLAAVQVIFQYFFSRADIKKIIKDFDGLNEDSLKRQLNNFDKKLFEKIVFGVSINEKKIQCLIEENLSENWIYERLDPTMRAIISLGVFELNFCLKTPYKVIIDEYVSIADLFFNKTNTGFINGILDNICKIIRYNERN
ncbi:MAG: N utilization substance protein B [Alphaproteobacteria bacterium MarineAlpha9_Bin4]|nr:transcription antitermination factor NusB [Pelagibacterales bacterium]PPR25949.1 MAG: N utilization substance protein B [Alphaproteobacteria bacterium MarineAlpha9_Bin4]|tara:strand:+ start:116 stop:556 length:441 start_codon:yes stop_codon:yes gene_type:complete